MENNQELKQKSVESYFEEFGVSDDKKERVLMAVTNMVYKMNQHIVQYEKESDDSVRNQILKLINENDELIRQKIKDILEGREDQINYDY